MTEMTIGELSRRTGLSVKAIRDYEERGLIYTVGRSPGNYRLFDESALWRAQVIATLRSVGLTVRASRLAAALDIGTCAPPDCPDLEPVGVPARVAVGATLIALALL